MEWYYTSKLIHSAITKQWKEPHKIFGIFQQPGKLLSNTRNFPAETTVPIGFGVEILSLDILTSLIIYPGFVSFTICSLGWSPFCLLLRNWLVLPHHNSSKMNSRKLSNKHIESRPTSFQLGYKRCNHPNGFVLQQLLPPANHLGPPLGRPTAKEVAQ